MLAAAETALQARTLDEQLEAVREEVVDHALEALAVHAARIDAALALEVHLEDLQPQEPPRGREARGGGKEQQGHFPRPARTFSWPSSRTTRSAVVGTARSCW